MKLNVIMGALLFLSASAISGEPLVSVYPGIHQLTQSPWIEKIQNKRIGVLAHFASQTRESTHLVDLLFKRTDLTLSVIFAPEHGYRSAADDLLPDSKDPVTGINVYSLYGPRRAPTPELLNLLDVLVIDLQDVGMRYYTYGATVALTLQACKAAGKKVILLDRPNPIGGQVVSGAMLDPVFSGGLTTYFPIPTQHGMTLGELALFYNGVDGLKIGADLEVVPALGWKRNLDWQSTDLLWRNPSPALTHPDQATLYGAFGTLEGLDLAVGRGITNEEAFRIYGAPWISENESVELTQKLNSLGLNGITFEPVSWIPTRSDFVGQLCHGFRINLKNRAELENFRALVEVLKAMKNYFGARLDLEPALKMLGSRWILDGIAKGEDTQKLIEASKAEREPFMKARERVLIKEYE